MSVDGFAKDLISLSLLLPWNIFVIYYVSRKVYDFVSRIKGHRVGVYISRKIIHMLSGGITAIILPMAFTGPYLPSIAALGLAIAVYIPHKKGKLLYWFQVEDNLSEVYFAVIWGLAVLVMWFIDTYLAIVSISFMAFGDGITGIVRILLYAKRTKSWIGNIAMAIVCIPLGYIYYGLVGALAGLIASIIEHFEFVDDNLSVPIVSLIILSISRALCLP